MSHPPIPRFPSSRLLFWTACCLMWHAENGPAAGAEPSHPNVLLICVDDLRNCLSLDGDPIARKPHLDKLASESRYFRHHFVQVAACGPSRLSPCRADRKPLEGQRAQTSPSPAARDMPMTVRSARNVEKQKKKARRRMPRAKLTRISGNTLGVRRRLKKLAGKARATARHTPR